MKLLWRYVLLGVAALAAPFAFAEVPQAAQEADIVILGEIHDNAHHHARQADWIEALSPTAVVFEMLSPDDAASLPQAPRDADRVTQALGGARWGNIQDYVPLILASQGMVVGAAVEREKVRGAFSDGAAAHFGQGAKRFGLTSALPQEQLERRMQLQFEAHCEAMPLDMMRGMVEAQRLRDAWFARVTLEALATYGSPVVLVTGNGHARRDWGVPMLLERAAPDAGIFSLGQSEEGLEGPDGGYDLVLSSPKQKRDDPCAALR